MISLSNAGLCLNCETISDARTEYCPRCAAIANWLPLGRLLGSTEKKQEVKTKGAAA
jgi:hypothetical protein